MLSGCFHDFLNILVGLKDHIGLIGLMGLVDLLGFDGLLGLAGLMHLLVVVGLVCQVWLILDNFVLFNMIQRYFQMKLRPLIFQRISTIPKSLMV